MRYAVLVAAAAALTALPAAADWSPEKAAFATSTMQKFIGTAKGQTPGMSVGVSVQGAPVFTEGAGFAVPGQPVTANTAFAIGSVTKQLTAATLLALIEKKGGSSFSLDTKVKDVLPDSFPFSKSGAETIRNVLNMQTGYAVYTKPPAATAGLPDGAAPIERSKLRGYVYSLLRQFPAPAFPAPGTQYVYNNTNYYLASLMIEQLGGFADYRDAMKSYVFTPAGMTQSGFVGAPPAGVTVALPPYDTTGSVVNKPHWPRGAGDVISTTPDLLKWHAALVTNKILGKAMGAMMTTPPAGSPYGMGWNVTKTLPFIWYDHAGVIAGYSAHDGIFVNTQTKQWVSVAVLSSNDGVPVQLLAVCFAQLAMDPSATLKGLSPLAKKACGISTKGLN